MRPDHRHPSALSPSHARAEPNFEEELRDSLRRAPWLAVSAGFHAILFLVMAQFPWSVGRDVPNPLILVAAAPDVPVDPIEPPEPPEPPDKPIETPEDVEDEVVVDEVLDDPAEDVSDTTGPVDDAHDANPDMMTLGVGSGWSAGGGGPGGGRIGRKGGTAKSQQTVDLALEWLSRHQDPGGFWSSYGFSAQCETNLCDGDGDTTHDVGVTGLALLSFLGSGHFPNRETKYTKVVRGGLRYLVHSQDEETGCFGEVGSHETFLYDHALASLAVIEAYGFSRWPQLKTPAQRAVTFIQHARNPYKAWRYHYPPNGDNDVSVTGWMVMALKAAQDAGLRVDPRALDGARDYLDSMTDENTGRTGYAQKGGYSSREKSAQERWPADKTEAMTAVAMLCRVFLGEDPDRSPALRAGADRLRGSLPVYDVHAGTTDFYYWYYGSYAMYQMGGKDWSVWERRMKDAIVDTQRRDGDEAGSWDPQPDPWGSRGGRVYSTAILALCLEVFYRYDRVVGAR